MAEPALAPVAHAVRAHAKLSASGADGWMVCTMRPTMEEGRPDEKSVDSLMGTWGHERNDIRIRHLIGELSQTECIAALQAHEDSDVISAKAKDEVRPLSEMCVTWAIKKLKELYKEYGKSNVVVLVERKLNYSRYAPEGFGTSDLTIFVPGKMFVIDWKLGRMKVKAYGNRQLRLYGVGGIETFGIEFDFDEVEMYVVQPQWDHVDSYVQTVAELLDWAENTVKPIAQIAFTGIGATYVPDVTGETGQCDFCRARGDCKARAEAMLEVAGDMTPVQILSDDEIRAVYPSLKMLVSWAEDVKKVTDKRVLAGNQNLGLKIVAGKTNREIVDVSLAKRRLAEAGFFEDEFTEAPPAEAPLLALGKLEKLAGKSKLPKILGDALVKPPGEPTVVLDSDPRPVFGSKPTTAEDEFGEFDEPENQEAAS